jgi:aryl-alcohol dehydrogenase-like predicted oxidoreductase
MKYRVLGQTGKLVSLLGLGGEASVQGDQDLAIEIVNKAIDLGVNYIDTSWWYPAGTGQSEQNIGEVMKTRRDEVFLATKSHNRDYDTVMSNIVDSLNRLNTDHVDLYQLHDVRYPWELDEIFQPTGALKAMEELRIQGVVHNIGITGHYDPAILLQAMNQFPFDTILLPLNAADVWHVPFQQEVLQTAVQKNMGIIAMKVAGKGRILGPGRLTMEQAMNYVYSFPVSTAIVGISTVSELEEDYRISYEFSDPLSEQEMESLELATESYQDDVNQYKV